METMNRMTVSGAPFVKQIPEAPSKEKGTIPPSEYVQDYYSPPPDWVPAKEIREYNANTRVPDHFWLKYDGAYALALRIAPIAANQLKKDIKAQLIDEKNADSIFSFSSEAERDESTRTIVLRDLAVSADDFIELSFKMKASVKNASADLRVTADGVATLLSSRDIDSETACTDGFHAYKVKFPPRKGALLRNIEITAGPASGAGFEQEFILFDFILKRNAPKARFTDLPERCWIPKALFDSGREITPGCAISDVRAFLETHPEGVESMPLPMNDIVLRPRTEKEDDGGFRVETIRETIGGKEFNALRITLEKGPRCYLKFPVNFDAVKFNTITFLAKIDLPDGISDFDLYRKSGRYAEFQGNESGNLNSFFDTFSFGVTSLSHDHMEWARYGVLQGLFPAHVQKSASVPSPWESVAFDLRNGDMAGNKTSVLREITHWCFYYANNKIPAGQKVVVTIVDPRVSSGLMQSGGDMARYRKFLTDAPLRFMKAEADDRKFLEPPQTNRLPSPLPFLRNHMPQAEFILAEHPEGQTGKIHRQIVMRGIDYIQDFLKNKYGVFVPVPVLDEPSALDNVKIFLGGSAYASIDNACFREDMKKLTGSTGFAIRAKDRNLYIYAADFKYGGNARGLVCGLYTLFENNTDEIMAVTFLEGKKTACRSVFDIDKSGNLDLVWGDGYVNTPAFPLAVVFRSDPRYMDRNCGWYEDGKGDLRETRGGLRGYMVGHWWGHIGTGYDGPENETWGMDEQGRRIPPDSYSRNVCMINVLENAKREEIDNFLGEIPGETIYSPAGKSFRYNNFDLFGLWPEDNFRLCQCEKCRTPIRLPGGTLLGPESPHFRGTQYFLQGSAMVNAVNVHVRRDIRVESIGYFWLSTPPLVEISRNYDIRFCPYIRKNFFEPIYAPCNDHFYRHVYRWSQIPGIRLRLYDYFLGMCFRPWATTAKYDNFVHRDILGVEAISHEGEREGGNDLLERWVVFRLFREPDRDVNELRRYFIQRTFREAAPEMEKFYSVFYNFVFENFMPYQPMEFEDGVWLGVLAFRTASRNMPEMSVMEEMDLYMKQALSAVKNPMSRWILERLAGRWNAYRDEARGYADSLNKANSCSGKTLQS